MCTARSQLFRHISYPRFQSTDVHREQLSWVNNRCSKDNSSSSSSKDQLGKTPTGHQPVCNLSINQHNQQMHQQGTQTEREHALRHITGTTWQHLGKAGSTDTTATNTLHQCKVYSADISTGTLLPSAMERNSTRCVSTWWAVCYSSYSKLVLGGSASHTLHPSQTASAYQLHLSHQRNRPVFLVKYGTKFCRRLLRVKLQLQRWKVSK